MGINRTGGCIKKIGKPRSGVQDVSQEEIGEKRAVTDRKREGSRWRRNAAGTEGGKRTTQWRSKHEVWIIPVNNLLNALLIVPLV